MAPDGDFDSNLGAAMIESLDEIGRTVGIADDLEISGGLESIEELSRRHALVLVYDKGRSVSNVGIDRVSKEDELDDLICPAFL